MSEADVHPLPEVLIALTKRNPLTEEETPPDETVGEGEYVVKQGECINSISARHGFFPGTVWDHALNEELRRVRKRPDQLLPGDRVHIPSRETREVHLATNKRHVFRRLGVPAYLNVKLLFLGEPLADKRYSFACGDKRTKGTLDSKGALSEPISPGAISADIIVELEDDPPLKFHVELGAVDPDDTTTGLQARLSNLGHLPGPVDGQKGPRTRCAVTRFQRVHGLDVTGELDDSTAAKLKEVHDG